MKVLLFLYLLSSILLARENPFIGIFEKPEQALTPIPLLLEQNTPKKTIPFVEKPPVLTKPISKPIVKSIPPAPQIKKKTTSTKKKKITKKVVKKITYKTIYKNYFLQILSNGKNFKIITKDHLFTQTKFSKPTRIALDFKKLQYFHTKSITLNNRYNKKVTLGSHHDFYRMTILTNKYKRYTAKKKPYGYLLSFY